MELANKRALITGASQGLGRAIAQRLAAAGVDIALHYKDSAEKAQQTAQQIKQLSRRSLAVQADLRPVRFPEHVLHEKPENGIPLFCIICCYINSCR